MSIATLLIKLALAVLAYLLAHWLLSYTSLEEAIVTVLSVLIALLVFVYAQVDTPRLR